MTRAYSEDLRARAVRKGPIHRSLDEIRRFRKTRDNVIRAARRGGAQGRYPGIVEEAFLAVKARNFPPGLKGLR